MEEQAKQALSQLLERAVQGVDAAVEFSQAQVPDVVEQLLMWHMVESVSFCVLALSLISIGLLPQILLFRFYKKEKDGAIFVVNGIVFVFFTLPLTLGAFEVGDLNWLQILIAPKLYLLEYAAQLVK